VCVLLRAAFGWPFVFLRFISRAPQIARAACAAPSDMERAALRPRCRVLVRPSPLRRFTACLHLCGDPLGHVIGKPPHGAPGKGYRFGKLAVRHFFVNGAAAKANGLHEFRQAKESRSHVSYAPKEKPACAGRGRKKPDSIAGNPVLGGPHCAGLLQKCNSPHDGGPNCGEWRYFLLFFALTQ